MNYHIRQPPSLFKLINVLEGLDTNSELSIKIPSTHSPESQVNVNMFSGITSGGFGDLSSTLSFTERSFEPTAGGSFEAVNDTNKETAQTPTMELLRILEEPISRPPTPVTGTESVQRPADFNKINGLVALLEQEELFEQQHGTSGSEVKFVEAKESSQADFDDQGWSASFSEGDDEPVRLRVRKTDTSQTQKEKIVCERDLSHEVVKIAPLNFSMAEGDCNRALIDELEKLQGLDIRNLTNMAQKLDQSGSPVPQLLEKEYSEPNNAIDTSRTFSNDGFLEPCLSERLHHNDRDLDGYKFKTHKVRVDNKCFKMKIGVQNASWEELSDFVSTEVSDTLIEPKDT